MGQLILLLLLLVSCTHTVEISALGCPTEARWISPESLDQTGEHFQRRFWSRPGTTEVLIAELLDQNGLSCQEVQGFEVQLSTDSADFFLSLTPFIKRQTLDFWVIR